jgi:arylformamidase
VGRLYDITPEVSGQLAVWPGDTPVRREVLLDLGAGDSVTLSTLHATVHLGAHADAPSHYAADGESIDRCPLELYLGRCRVVAVRPARGGRIQPGDLPRLPPTERMLFRTGTYPDPRRFEPDFAALSPELIEHLAESGTRLVGIDTPSVDPFDSKELPTHRACRRRDVAILEGLALASVPEGEYELIALPLRLAGFDASPVRAVLRELG